MQVTIVVPMKNTERWIGAALSSLLSQDYGDIEVIVVDDGSTDESRKRALQVGDRRVRVVENVGKGTAAAWNLGTSLARGELLMRCDSDDLFPPNRVASHVSWLRVHPNVGALAGSCTMINERSRAIVRLPFENRVEQSIREELSSGRIEFHPMAITVRTPIARELGPARPFFRLGEDHDFLLRLGERCDVWYSPDECYQARLRRSSATHSVTEQELEWWANVVAEFQRQRRGGGSDDLARGMHPQLPSFPLGRRISPSEQAQNFLIAKSWNQLVTGDVKGALSTGVRAAFTRPGYRAAISLGKLAAKSVLTRPDRERQRLED